MPQYYNFETETKNVERYSTEHLNEYLLHEDEIETTELEEIAYLLDSFA